jgi:glycosyltransferase involved in cell wall biosynthesis
MDNPIYIEDLIAGKRAVFVNAIRADIPSGGNTATARLLDSLRGVCDLREVALTPRAGAAGAWSARLLFLLESFPAPVMILLSRRFHAVWLEFFLRLSLIYLLRCVWVRLVHRPHCVFLNHHASFAYAFVFAGCTRILVWHDVPSMKRDASWATKRAAGRSAWLEKRFIRKSDYNVTFSFDDRKTLRRLHQRNAFVIPVIKNELRPRAPLSGRTGMLLVGNWSRMENSEGAASFLEAYAEQTRARPAGAAVVSFHVAGHGADSFVAQLLASKASVRTLSILATARYGDIRDFAEFVMLAPVLRGAGIKLKTIEAWSCGIPVVGTRQAFTGIPASIWKVGGIKVDSPDAMARLCGDPEALARQCEELDPARAFAMYQAAILAHAQAAAATDPAAR